MQTMNHAALDPLDEAHTDNEPGSKQTTHEVTLEAAHVLP